jgi:hypothetical protein
VRRLVKHEARGRRAEFTGLAIEGTDCKTKGD